MPELQTGAINILRYIWAQILDDIRVTKMESLVQYALKRSMMNNNKKSEKNIYAQNLSEFGGFDLILFELISHEASDRILYICRGYAKSPNSLATCHILIILGFELSTLPINNYTCWTSSDTDNEGTDGVDWLLCSS